MKFGISSPISCAGDQHAQVVGDHLAQHFVELTDLGLAAERISKLGLDHAERRLDVRPLVVAAEEGVSLVAEQVVHLDPGRSPGQRLVAGQTRNGRESLNGMNGRTACVADRLQVALRRVRLVGSTSRNSKFAAVLSEQRHELAVVGGTCSMVERHLDRGDDVGAHTGHGVQLDPFTLRLLMPHLWSYQRTKRQVEKPVESAAKSLSTPLSGRADSSMSPLRTGVISGERR